MKITLDKDDSVKEDELILRCREMTPLIQDVLRVASGGEDRIPCADESGRYMLPVRDILYAESVDRVTFLYTRAAVYRTPCSLRNLEAAFPAHGFFRCSKSMLLNLYRVASLRSESGGRIDAEMENGEHVMISRRYAAALRRELKGENES